MQTRKFKKIMLLLLTAAMICMTATSAMAAVVVPDPDQTGTITVTMQDPDTKKPVSGGVLTLYQVGDVQEENGDYSFALTDAFSGSDLSLADPASAELAASLAKYAQDNSLTGVKASVGQDGKAAFSGLELGLYLLVQTQPAGGYYAVNPFLVSIPVKEGETYLYEVDATPKMGQLVKAPEETKPSTPDPVTPVPTPDPTPAPGPAPAPTLPQTGQLNWPVPVMAALGLLLFAIGWVLRMTGERRDGYAR